MWKKKVKGGLNAKKNSQEESPAEGRAPGTDALSIYFSNSNIH